MKLQVIGHDPSLRNWGIARGTYDTVTKELEITSLDVINPVLSEGKQVRQNSHDLTAAEQLYKAAMTASVGAQAVFVEVPIGSQSARAMASYGVCVGVLGALRGQGIPFFEMTPTEVKLAGFGKKTASKQEMITWAINEHPDAGWPTYTEKGQVRITESKAEHMADAVAAIHAGIASTPFKQLIAFL